MNRRKKIKQILAQRDKKANAKKRSSNKPRYISKAERLKLEQQEVTTAPDSKIVEQGVES